MTAVTVLMAAMTGFVLLAPVAMAVVLVTGGVAIRRPAAATATAAAGIAASLADCGCEGGCVCAAPAELPAAA